MEGNKPVLIFTTLVALLLILLAKCGYSLDMEGAKEQPCFKIDKTVPMDLDWIMSIKTWYYPVMSRYDLYKGAVDLANKRNSKDVSEDEVYYDSCITWEMGANSFVTHGFNGQKTTYNAKPLGAGLESYEFSTEGGNSGICYTTLTDNKTFTFAAGCLSENQMVWGVASTIKRLPKETIKLIHDHAESLGFKREFFTGLRYDSCNLDGDDEGGVCDAAGIEKSCN